MTEQSFEQRDRMREELRARFPRLTSGRFSIPSDAGWDGIIVAYLTVLDEKLPECAEVREMHFQQKWGSLTIYDDIRGIDDMVRIEVNTARSNASEESLHVCEICGAPGRLSKRGTWLTTVCPDHADDNGRIAIPVDSSKPSEQE